MSGGLRQAANQFHAILLREDTRSGHLAAIFASSSIEQPQARSSLRDRHAFKRRLEGRLSPQRPPS